MKTSATASICILLAILAGAAGYFLIPMLVTAIQGGENGDGDKAAFNSTARGTLMPSLANHKKFVARTGAEFPTISTEYPALMTRFASTAVGREGKSDRPGYGKRLGAWHDPREDDSVRYARSEQLASAKRSFRPELMLGFSEDFYTAMGK